MLYIGWFKFHREAFNKALWKTATPQQKVIFITLLGMVNFSPNEWMFKGKKFIAEPGQMITSLDSIIKECGKGITLQNVRTAIEKFKNLEFLTWESTKQGSLLTVINWEFYQGKDDEPNNGTNKQLTGGQQTANKQLTTIEEGKEDQEGKKDKPLPKKPKSKKTDPPNEKEWIPTEATQEASKKHGYSKMELFKAITLCFDWHRGKGKQMVDWDAVLRNWIEPKPHNNYGKDFKIIGSQLKVDNKGVPINEAPEPDFNKVPNGEPLEF